MRHLASRAVGRDGRGGRHYGDGVPALDESHDFAHPVESDSAWSESYYFNCYDPETDSGFFSRIGIRPNEGTIDAGCSFWLPGGGLAPPLRLVGDEIANVAPLPKLPQLGQQPRLKRKTRIGPDGGRGMD